MKVYRTLKAALRNKRTTEELHFNAKGEYSLPNEIFLLTKLRALSLENAQLRTLPTNLKNLPNLHWLYIGQAAHVPKKVKNPPPPPPLTKMTAAFWEGLPLNLTELHLVNISIGVLPAAIGNFKKLRKLTLAGCEISQLSDALALCTELEYINLSNNKLKTLPSYFANFSRIQEFLVGSNYLTELCDMKNWRSLHHLSIAYNNFSQFPDGFADHSKIKTLNVEGNQIQRLSPNFMALKSLHTLNLSSNPFNEDITEWLELPTLRVLKCNNITHLKNIGQYFGVFFPAPKKLKIPLPHARAVYDVYQNNTAKIAKMSDEQLLQAFRVDNRQLYAIAAVELGKRAAKKLEECPIKTGCEIAVLGEISYNKNELRSRLTQKKITYSPQIRSSTTHVVFGKGAQWSGKTPSSSRVWMSDRNLEQFFQTQEEQYLRQAEPEEAAAQQANLSQLLLSLDEENIELGLQLLKSGGVPAELLTELFLIAKDTNMPTSFRKTARQLFELQADETDRLKLDMRVQMFPYGLSEDLAYRNMTKYFSKGNLDAVKAAEYLLRYRKVGYQFLLSVLPDMQARIERLRQFVDNPNYVFHAYHYPEDKTEELQHCDFITNANYSQPSSHWVYKEFPDELFYFPHLKKLSLAWQKIEEFPKTFVRFKDLEFINISHINYLVFPEVFLKMPQLKVIKADFCTYLSNNRGDSEAFYDYSQFEKTGLLYRKEGV